jgi:hypothetical protein
MDELLVKSFADIVQRKYDEGQLSGPPRGSPEHQLLTQALMPGFQWGIAAAAVQFVILRRVPIHVTKRYTQQKIPSASKRESILFRTPPKDMLLPYFRGNSICGPVSKKGPSRRGSYSRQSRCGSTSRCRSTLVRLCWIAQYGKINASTQRWNKRQPHVCRHPTKQNRLNLLSSLSSMTPTLWILLSKLEMI